MIRKTISPKQVVEFLNELVKIDKNAISDLFNFLVRCNAELRDHKTVQVKTINGTSKVGLLGILNGLFGVFDKGKYKDWGIICRVLENDRETIIRFELVKNEK